MDGGQIDPAACLGLHPAGNQRHRLAQSRRVHIVEQQPRRAGLQCGFDLVQPIDLADDLRNPGGDRAADRLAHRARDRDVVVLDHRRIPQPHAVIRSAAHPGRVFLEMAQPRQRLARVEQRAGGIVHRPYIFAGHRGDSREMLDRVERGALGGQHGARIARQPHQLGPRRHLRPLLDQRIDLHLGIERTKERRGHRQARDHDRIAAVHHPRKPRVFGDHALAGDIVPAAGQPLAQILGQGGADEGGQIEGGQIDAGKGECGHGAGVAQIGGGLKHGERRSGPIAAKSARNEEWPAPRGTGHRPPLGDGGTERPFGCFVVPQPGSDTASVAWITPFEAAISVATTVAVPPVASVSTTLPPSTRATSSPPATVVRRASPPFA